MNPFNEWLFIGLACITIGTAGQVVRITHDTATTRGGAALFGLVMALIGVAGILRAGYIEANRRSAQPHQRT